MSNISDQEKGVPEGNAPIEDQTALQEELLVKLTQAESCLRIVSRMVEGPAADLINAYFQASEKHEPKR